MADVQPIPEGYPRVSPYLTVDGADAAIEFYGQVIGTTERVRMPGPDGKIAHAELQLGDSVIMLSDAIPMFGNRSPKDIGGSPVVISVYMEDVDAVMAKAEEAGATIDSPATDQFYGDRSGQFTDPFGHRWNIQTHIEDVSPDEMEQRLASSMGGG